MKSGKVVFLLHFLEPTFLDRQEINYLPVGGVLMNKFLIKISTTICQNNTTFRNGCSRISFYFISPILKEQTTVLECFSFRWAIFLHICCAQSSNLFNILIILPHRGFFLPWLEHYKYLTSVQKFQNLRAELRININFCNHDT